MRNRRWVDHVLWRAALLVLPGALCLLGVLGAMPSAARPMAGMSMAGMSMAGAVAAKGPVVALHKAVVRISIHNFAFVPAQLVVSPGTRIIWTNTDSDPHTVDSTKNIWSSEALDTDGRFTRTFKVAGTFTYYCSIHPFMHGSIVVKK